MIGLLYDFVHVLVMALAIVSAVCSFVFADADLPAVIAVTMLSCVIAVLPPKLKSRGRILLGGMLLAVLSGVILTREADTRMDFIREHLWVLAVFLGCVGCVLFNHACRYIRNLRIIPVLAGTAVLLFSLFASIPMRRPAVLAILLWIVLSLCELIQNRWRKEGDGETEVHMVFSFPVIAVLFLILSLLKIPAVPYDWKFAKDLLKELRSGYELVKETLNLQNSWDEEDAEVGFSEDSRFFGRIGGSSYKVFEALSNHSAGEELRLMGKTFDTFEGRSWIKKDDSEENCRMYDILETISAIQRFDPDHVRDYIRIGTLQIAPEGLRTAHVFSPVKSIPEAVNEETVQKGGDLLFSKQNRRRYAVRFYRLNRSYEGFEALLNQNAETIDPISEEGLKNAESMVSGEDLSGITLAGLQAYRTRIREVYGEKPILSDRAEALLEEELAGIESGYQKLLKIESMLSRMNYTTSPGTLPEYVNSAESFLDYFLFESGEGYCTHFASAFVLLSRYLGIPARYVQGYCFVTEEGTTQVMSDTAHAWPQAYLEGIGWLDFEPSPGRKRASGWTVRKDTENEDGDSAEDMAAWYRERYGTQDGKEPVNPEGNEPSRKPEGSSFFAVLSLSVLFLLAFIPMDLFYRKIRYRRMSLKEKVRDRFEACMRILKRMGLKIREGETLSEFARRASQSLGAEVLTFIFDYETMIYGERPVSEEDAVKMEQACSALRKLFWQRLTQRGNREEEEPSGTPGRQESDSGGKSGHP